MVNPDGVNLVLNGPPAERTLSKSESLSGIREVLIFQAGRLI